MTLKSPELNVATSVATLFNECFNELMNALSKIINKHAPIQKASRKQKRFLKKPWLTKGPIISIKTKQKLHRTHFLGGIFLEKKL